jgi:hypothetical protein
MPTTDSGLTVPYQPPRKKHWRDNFTPPVIATLIISLSGAVISGIALRTANRAFESNRRAWLKADYRFPEYFTALTAAAVQVQIKNVGDSVALNSIAYTNFEIADSQKGPTFTPPFTYQAHLPAIFPTDTQAFPLTRTPTNPNGLRRALTTTEVEDLLNGKAYIAIFGQVRYSDQFGKHWTRYCAWRQVQGPIIINDVLNTGPCIAWEAVGDGEPPK